YTVLRLHHEFGQVSNPYARKQGRSRALDTSDMNYLASLISANPAIYLDELQERLETVHNIEVSIAPIS
ncbi:hypothetical protein BDQ17DRAFT_1229868, partial [Cyathus striatus]